MIMKKILIHQIFYDEESKSKVMKGFIPLDNSNYKDNGWFEFSPMLSFLRTTELEDDVWYGFLSPRFFEKTNFSSEYVINLIEKIGHLGDVALFPTGWDQLSYFLNPWEQGEIWHPGIQEKTQLFLDSSNFKINLKNIVTDTTTSVFSNFIVAKKNYWIEWKKISELFFNYEESTISNSYTKYRNSTNKYLMKAFIQERFASLILATGKYKTFTPDISTSGAIFSQLFPNDINTRRLLITCDILKQRYRQDLSEDLLNSYWKIRNTITFKRPV